MKKTLDKKNRWRNKVVAFRMSDAEARMLDDRVRTSGLSKQTYLINRVLEQEVVVNGNPRVYKGLRNLFRETLERLEVLEKVTENDSELLELILYMSTIMDGLKERADE
ncbi:MAG: mobilization protein [Anaeromicrobium sp.]|jgi:hypothetical protein|uniref:plasmid mobilization protein n=1 Tax=Anaeromicrobium sp. TaxID=1929132 RepID=UPI0025F1C7D2|nr:mobilization protein [Anaeromicrobium sp.]MCT4592869.1 mobilization protein [Anaeromicrobium sp.]